MNKYIQDYLKEKEEKKKKNLARKVSQLVQKIEIGEKVYREDSVYSNDEYPNIDKNNGKPYKYDIGEASTEEYEMLIQSANPNLEETEQLSKKVNISKWYTFAKIMIILGGIAVAILFFAELLTRERDRDWTAFFIVLGSYLMELGFWAIVQLLAGIKYNLDTQKQS